MILLNQWFERRDTRKNRYEIYRKHCYKAKEAADYYLLKVSELYSAMNKMEYSVSVIEFLTKVYNEVTPYRLQSVAYILAEADNYHTFMGLDFYADLVTRVEELSVAAGRAREAVEFADYLMNYEEEE